MKRRRLRSGENGCPAVRGGRLVIEPQPQPQPRYTLEELLAQCDLTARRSKEDREWLNSNPVGGELI